MGRNRPGLAFSSDPVAIGFAARLYQYPALPISPSLRWRYAWTHAPTGSSMSCAVSCAAFHSPRASCHNATSAGDSVAGGVLALSD